MINATVRSKDYIVCYFYLFRSHFTILLVFNDSSYTSDTCIHRVLYTPIPLDVASTARMAIMSLLLKNSKSQQKAPAFAETRDFCASTTLLVRF